MTVGTLQKHLRDLAGFLATTGGKKVAEDLTAVADGLSLFADQQFGEFAAFLKTADEYRRTGVLPVKASPSSKPKAESALLPAARSSLGELYAQARTLTADQIRSGVDAATKKLKAPELKQLAEVVEIGSRVNKLTMPKIVEAILKAVMDRKDMADRSDQ